MSKALGQSRAIDECLPWRAHRKKKPGRRAQPCSPRHTAVPSPQNPPQSRLSLHLHALLLNNLDDEPFRLRVGWAPKSRTRSQAIPPQLGRHLFFEYLALAIFGERVVTTCATERGVSNMVNCP
jgi:hypothetical protein